MNFVVGLFSVTRDFSFLKSLASWGPEIDTLKWGLVTSEDTGLVLQLGEKKIHRSLLSDFWTKSEQKVWANMYNSLGSEFSSQGHFHSLELLNVS